MAQVKKLEEYLGIKLFIKDKNRIVLSREGKIFAEKIIPAFDMLEQAVIDFKIEKRYKVVISTIPSLAAHFLLPYLDEFHKEYPDIDLELHYFLDGQYHPDSHFVLGFYEHGLPNKEHIYLLFSAASLPMCSSSYFSGEVFPLLPEHIARHNLLHDHKKNAWQDWFKAHGSSDVYQKIDWEKGNVYSDFNLLYTSVMRNNGIALCPYILLQEEIAAGKLAIASLQLGNKERCYYLAVNKPCRDTISQAIVDWLMQLARQREDAGKKMYDQLLIGKK